MKWLAKVTDFIGGSLFKEVKEGVMAYFPPDMTPAQKLEAEKGIQEFLHKKEIEVNRQLSEASVQLDKRINEQEGTAADLKTIPILGACIIFLRGVQRPAWGFATMYMDNKWFFSAGAEFTEQQQTAMIIINVLVLGFLFGERTIKNLEPLIIKVFGNNK